MNELRRTMVWLPNVERATADSLREPRVTASANGGDCSSAFIIVITLVWAWCR